MAQIKYACYAYIKLIGLIGAIRNGCSRVRPLCDAEIFRRFCSFFNRFNVIIQITFSHLIKIKIMNLWFILFILINLQYTYVWINFKYILKVSRFKSTFLYSLKYIHNFERFTYDICINCLYNRVTMTEKFRKLNSFIRWNLYNELGKQNLLLILKRLSLLWYFFLWHPIIPHNETATITRAGSLKQMHKTNTNLSRKKICIILTFIFGSLRLHTHTLTTHTACGDCFK